MKAIIGLGNPEDAYRGTRHNAGFEAIDKLGAIHGISTHRHRRKFQARMGKGLLDATPVVLVKPQTYMNLSGRAVCAVMSHYRIPPEDLIVICDDANLPLGDIRVRPGGSAGGHNGMKNIIAMLGTNRFTRVRIGIGAAPAGWDMTDHVLGCFSSEEAEAMKIGVERACEAVAMILDGGIETAMNAYNRITDNERVT